MRPAAAAPLLACALLAPCRAPAVEAPDRCPEGSRPARTPDPQWPWACVLAGERYRQGVDCPPGSEPVTVSDAFDPFKCALVGVRLVPPKGPCPPGHRAVPSEDPSKGYDCKEATSGFEEGPKCPRGTRPVATPGRLKPFRCESVPPAAPAAAASGKCPPGTRRRPTEDPFSPSECVPMEDSSPRPPGAADYRRFRVPGEFSLDVPVEWHLNDAWRDEVPSIILNLGLRRDGRPVTLAVSRQRMSSPSFVDMETAVRREKEWRRASEEGRSPVGGAGAVRLSVQDESKTAFVRAADGYYSVTYSAPSDLFGRYLPVYERALKSMKFEEEK